MKKMANVSVILPYYNTERYLVERCLKSILIQTYTDIEILIINDGSDAFHTKIITELSKLDSRIYLVNKKNTGVSDSRNVGIQLAHGEYIWFVDDDDEISPYSIDTAYNIAKKTNADMIVGGVTNYCTSSYENFKKLESPTFHIIKQSDFHSIKPHIIYEVYRFSDDGYISRGPVSRLVKKKVATQNLFNNNISIGEDIIWNLKILNLVKSICVVEEIWYGYCYNNNSVTKKYNPAIQYEVEKELYAIKKELGNTEDKEELCAYASHIIEEIQKIYYCYLHNIQSHLSHKEKQRIKSYIYYKEPWIFLKRRKLFLIANKKLKMKLFLYRTHLIFLVLRFKKTN